MHPLIEKEKVVLIRPQQRRNAYQFFMNWLCEAWEEADGLVHPNLNISWPLRLLAAKMKLARQIIRPRSGRAKLLILCGGYPDSFVWPFSYRQEVVPFIWDCWPRYWPRLIDSLRRNRIRLLFCTSSQVVNFVQRALPDVKSVWIPEGIKTAVYPEGKPLSDREYDVLELGRQLERYHGVILTAMKAAKRQHVYQREGGGLLFPDFESLVAGLCNSKITVCFPRCDTHPEHAGSVETLTQRYWECMLARTLMVGRAPKELVDVVGYNPVIEVDWQHPAEQLDRLLDKIEEYQAFVDHNRMVALGIADWAHRVRLMRRHLNLPVKGDGAQQEGTRLSAEVSGLLCMGPLR